MPLTAENVPRFGKRFLEDIDQYISSRYKKLACDDISQIYFSFFHDMKLFKGNANGFTGLSEFLVFRSLYHYLGGSFGRVQTTKDAYEFVSSADRHLRLSQGTRIGGASTKGPRIYPDIAVSYAKA